MNRIIAFVILLMSVLPILSLPCTLTIPDSTAWTVIRNTCQTGASTTNTIMNSKYVSLSGLCGFSNTGEAFGTKMNAANAVCGALELNPAMDPYWLTQVHSFITNLNVSSNNSNGIIYQLIDPAGDSPTTNSLTSSEALSNIALMVDCMWEYEYIDDDDRAAYCEKLNALASFVYRRLVQSRGYGFCYNAYIPNEDSVYATWFGGTVVWPTYTQNNYRLTALGALGYAAVVLRRAEQELPGEDYDADDYLDLVDEELTGAPVNGSIACSRNASEADSSGYFYINGPGYLNHNSILADVEDGAAGRLISEGPSYTSQVLDRMCLFFTARNNLPGNSLNYYNIIVADWLRSLLPLIGPDCKWITFDDSYNECTAGVVFCNGVIEYLNQGTDEGLKSDLLWYLSEYFSQYGVPVSAWV